jgi:hypothetical protein
MRLRIFQAAGICFLLAAFANNLQAQDSAAMSQVKDAIRTALDSVAKTTEVQPIGALILRPSIPHYFIVHYLHASPQPMRGVNNLAVSRVTMYLQDGYIIDINVYAEGRHFTNGKEPIGVTQRRFQASTVRLANIENPNEFVKFNEVLQDDSLTSFVPADGFYQLTPSVNKLVLYRNVGINTVLDIRLYTDALGLLGSSSNGVIQTDFRLKQAIHRMNWYHTDLYSLDYVKVNFNASKFTGNNGYVDSSKLSRTALLQNSFLNAEIATDLIHFRLDYKSINMGYLDAGAAIHEAHLITTGDTATVLMADWFLEAGLDIKSSDNAGFNLNLRFIDDYSAQTPWNNNASSRIFWRAGAEVYWNPFNSKANRLFARTYFLFANKQADKPNSFFQLQLGYSLLLSSLVKK